MSQQVTRIPRARRRWPLIAIGGGIAVFAIFGALTGFYVNLLWFREDARLPSVFWSVFWTKAVLILVFGAAFFSLLYANLLIVRRFSPRYRLFSPEQEVIDRYRGSVEPYMKWILPALSLVLAGFAAAGVAGYWERFLMWRHGAGVEFGGAADPIFGRDLSFFVFRLPFLHFVQGWLFSSLVVITIVVAAAHYLWGGIRFQAIGEKVTPTVKAHLSVLLGLIVLVKAWGYRLAQFDLLTSERGVVTGASYTDVNAQLPALRILVPIAIVCTILFLVNIRFRGWALPALGVGLLALASLVAGAAYPAFVQKFRVEPQELQREEEFIDRNIEFTNLAYGLGDAVRRQPFRVDEELTAEDVEANPATISNIRLWDPRTLLKGFQQLQGFRPYYSFDDVDVDRYEVEAGVRRVVMISGREIKQDGIPEDRRSWQNLHLYFTHGYGHVASRVDRVTEEGQPDFVVEDIPPVAPDGELRVDDDPGPRIYFGERSDVSFVLVGTDQQELDRPTGAGEEGGETGTTYTGEGGVEVGGFFRKLAFAWRFRDVNLLISNLIRSDSRIMFNRDIETRVQKAAPFLMFDHDPYLAVADNRLVWIWDAYTHSDEFPYSQQTDLAAVSDLDGRVNYMRNSVKVTVDAYDGTLTYYVVDPSDPIIQMWQRAFPDLFTPGDQASESLRAHFRYPEDLFKVQASKFAQYHVDSATEFFSGQDFWALPQNPENAEGADATLDPYYVLMKLPGDEEESFVLFEPFTPNNRSNMISWFSADSDPENYGQLTAFEFQAGQNVPGPVQVFRRINQDTDVSRERTLLGQGGSSVVFGNLLAIPIENSFLYVQPMYIEATGSEGGIPELKRVILVHGQTVTIADTLQAALEQTFGDAGEPPPPPPDAGATVEELLQQALQHFRLARQALRDGDLGEYGRQIALAEQAVNDAAAAASGEDGGGSEPTPTPSASPSG